MKSLGDLMWSIAHPLQHFRLKQAESGMEQYIRAIAKESADMQFRTECIEPILSYLAALSPEERASAGITPEIVEVIRNTTRDNASVLEKYLGRLAR